VSQGTTEVHYVPIRSEQDCERLRGLRYDLVIEDASFFDSWRRAEQDLLMSLVRAYVLR
jgi:hypothetical protein